MFYAEAIPFNRTIVELKQIDSLISEMEAVF